jgi:hypothetical protein
MLTKKKSKFISQNIKKGRARQTSLTTDLYQVFQHLDTDLLCVLHRHHLWRKCSNHFSIFISFIRRVHTPRIIPSFPWCFGSINTGFLCGSSTHIIRLFCSLPIVGASLVMKSPYHLPPPLVIKFPIPDFHEVAVRAQKDCLVEFLETGTVGHLVLLLVVGCWLLWFLPIATKTLKEISI